MSTSYRICSRAAGGVTCDDVSAWQPLLLVKQRELLEASPKTHEVFFNASMCAFGAPVPSNPRSTTCPTAKEDWFRIVMALNQQACMIRVMFASAGVPGRSGLRTRPLTRWKIARRFESQATKFKPQSDSCARQKSVQVSQPLHTRRSACLYRRRWMIYFHRFNRTTTLVPKMWRSSGAPRRHSDSMHGLLEQERTHRAFGLSLAGVGCRSAG